MNVIQLSQELIAIPSFSQKSNFAVSQYLYDYLQALGFELEWLEHRDPNNERKISLVAKKGQGEGGIGFFSHTDTVPPGEGWDAFDPVIKNGKLYGRASCDMKGPLAATIVAARDINEKLNKPVYIVMTADEENGFGGARQVVDESKLLGHWPEAGVVAEPTTLQPVYAHKGAQVITVHARGSSAHTSLDTGVSATMKLIPFLNEVIEHAQAMKFQEAYMNHEFAPPTNGFNITINDYGTANNVTAAKASATINYRVMPNASAGELRQYVIDKAHDHGLLVETRGMDAFYTQPDNPIVRQSIALTKKEATTVPFGTEALYYQEKPTALVILGPGDIAQAHTVGEFIDIEQLEQSVEVYKELIRYYCIASS